MTWSLIIICLTPSKAPIINAPEGTHTMKRISYGLISLKIIQITVRYMLKYKELETIKMTTLIHTEHITLPLGYRNPATSNLPPLRGMVRLQLPGKAGGTQ